MDDVNEQLTKEFAGRRLKSGLEDLRGDYDYEGDSIVISVISRPYYTEEQVEELRQDWEKDRREWAEEMDEELDDDEEFECEEQYWDVALDVCIELDFDDNDQAVIRKIGYICNVYGDDGLGDCNPYEVFTDEEFDECEEVVRDFLKDELLPENEDQ